MLIDKYDIAKLVKFSVNIADSDINPFILKAERTLPTLASGNYDIFIPYVSFEYGNWNVQSDVLEGSFWEHNGLIYQSLAATRSEPSETSTEWKIEPLYTIFHLALKRYLVFKTYDYFLTIHGIDVAQAGLTQQTGEHFIPISDQRRKELIASNRTDLIMSENDLFSYLRKYEYLPAIDECRTESGIKGRFGIGVAKNKYRE
jgi:hypothetical protein